jgi:hypothetical protein
MVFDMAGAVRLAGIFFQQLRSSLGVLVLVSVAS